MPTSSDRISGCALFALGLAIPMIALPASAYATTDYFLTGNTLQDSCQADDGLVLGYVAAVADLLSFSLVSFDAQGQEVRQKRLLCITDGVQLKQVRDVVCKFVDANPQVRRDPVHLLARNALVKTWPCP